MVSTVSTWNNATVGVGVILNQVQNVYNEFGQQTHSYQAHGGSVNTSTSPKVQYSYAVGSANTIRMTGMTYPSSRVVSMNYGTANDINDASSRIESLTDTGVTLASYQHLGASGFVNAASAQPGITWTLYGSTNDPNTGDIYWGLDRFGRVDNCLWKKSTTTLAQIQYGYDRASNRTWRKDGVLTGYDELYSYDGLYRLDDQKRGTLNGTQTAITSGTFEQQWGLDPTGNWKFMKQDNNGNGTWDLVQLRSANKVNEITNANNTTGSAWATPSYDTAGNMIGIPNAGTTVTGSNPAWVPLTEAQWNTLTEAQWSALTENTGTTPQQLSASYDAWNRLVLITNGVQKVGENVYDARGYRIRKDTYASGTLTEARHYYYTPGWQCVEERVDASTNAERQFVWGLRYIDDLVLRDRSTANNGTLDERRYAMQDGNWNTIAICDTAGAVTERFAYSAYGTPVFMTGAGTVQASSPTGFETLYAGYRFDGNSPQMYCVRNRFLLPVIGTWNRRDPLGYVDGMGLYAAYAVLRGTDPFGLFEDSRYPRDPFGLIWIDTGVDDSNGNRIFKVIGLNSGTLCAIKHFDFKGVHHASEIVKCPVWDDPDKNYNCMRYAIGSDDVPTDQEWWQGDERSSTTPFPEESALKKSGCRQIPLNGSCKKRERKVALYECLGADDFHILRCDSSGKWSDKNNTSPVCTRIGDPDAHTQRTCNLAADEYKKTVWCCPDPVRIWRM